MTSDAAIAIPGRNDAIYCIIEGLQCSIKTMDGDKMIGGSISVDGNGFSSVDLVRSGDSVKVAAAYYTSKNLVDSLQISYTRTASTSPLLE